MFLEGSMLNVKSMTLESAINSVFSLCHIFDITPIIYHAVNKIVALADAIPDDVLGFLFIKF